MSFYEYIAGVQEDRKGETILLKMTTLQMELVSKNTAVIFD